VWLKERFHRANAQGQVVLPYAESSDERVTLVLTHSSGFADLREVILQAEKHEFNAAFLY
jgi:hypothetical protein